MMLAETKSPSWSEMTSLQIAASGKNMVCFVYCTQFYAKKRKFCFESVHVNFDMCSLWSLLVYMVFKKRHFIIPQNSSEE